MKKIGLDPTGEPELTVFVYDAGGKLIQEHSTIVQEEEDAKTVYTTSDHLGSPRINTDATGQVISRHDFHPFGEEIARTGYGSDTIRKQFTGYERDGETGLDYAQARYFSSRTGRFSSSDPILMSRDRQLDPQAINLYIYVRNNPLAYVDPDGRYFVGKKGRTVEASLDKNGRIKLKNATSDLKRMAKLINKSGSETTRNEFLAVAGNETKTNFRIEKRPVDNDLLGLHQAHDKNGKPLDWQKNTGGTGRFDGEPAYKPDQNGNQVYVEATITIFEGNIKDNLPNIQSFYRDSQMTSDEAVVGTFTHETDHNTNQEAIDAIRDRQEGRPNNFNVETPAEAVEKRAYEEIKRKRRP